MSGRNVLVVIHTPVYGGPHNQVVQMYNRLKAEGWNTRAVLPAEEGDGLERLREAGIPVDVLPLQRLRKSADPRVHFKFVYRFLSNVRSIERLIEARDIDLVQICGVMHPHAAIAARRSRVPVVWQFLSDFAPMTLRRLLMPVVKRNANVVMTTGKQIAELHPGTIESFGDRLITFFPPVDTEAFSPADDRRASVRQALGIPDDAVVAGTVGNRNRMKAHERMVAVADRLLDQHPSLWFVIAGAHSPTQADYYQEDVLTAAQRLPHRDRVVFVDTARWRPKDLLPAFDLFLLTSRAEGVPTALLEAAACGLPSVVTAVGGVAEAVVEGITGFVVADDRDMDRFAELCRRLIQDGGLRRTMGDSARRLALEAFDIEVCAARHATAYELAIRDASKPVEADRTTGSGG